MKPSPDLLERRRDAVAALLSAEAEPGVGRFSVPVVAQLLHVAEAVARKDASLMNGRARKFPHRLDRRGQVYRAGPCWQPRESGDR